MTVKVLVTAIGQHIVADVKQVENKETKEVIAYWISNPRTVSYSVDDNKQVNVGFGQYCLVSNETEFSLRADHVVTILEPREEVVERYEAIVHPPETVTTELTPTEAPDDTDSTDS
jgi:hypothetical protein